VFVSKISGGINNTTFRGYQHEINDVGKRVMRFNLPYDYEKNTDNAYLEIYKLRENDKAYTTYDIITDKPIATKKLDGKNGTIVDLDKLTNLDRDEAFAYRFIINGMPVVDSGIQKDGYNIVSRKGTTPLVQGAGVLTMPRIHRPGAYYDENGQIKYSVEKQRDAENSVNTFSTSQIGSLAGIHYDLPLLKKMGVKVLFLNPVPGADTTTHHGYSAENNNQIALNMATAENYDSFLKDLFKNGIMYVYDATLTSGGLQDNAFQYAQRWADKLPQSYYWFKMTGIKYAPLGLGVVPIHKENLRHKVLNAPVEIDSETNKIIVNKDYNPEKETSIQIYDASLVTPEQETDFNNPITEYRKLKTENALDINTHDDTVISYIFRVDPKEYERRLEVLLDFNKDNTNPIVQNSPEGTMLIAQFSNYKLMEKTEGGFVAWDANTDLAKKNFNISGYDEKINQAIVDPAERDFEKNMRMRGAFEVQDMSLQTCVYWAQRSKDAQLLYVAQTLKDAKSVEKINELIESGLLPKEAELNNNQLSNIIAGWYLLNSNGDLTRDELTTKSLMKYPLDTLEFANKTVGVLTTSYFSNRATSEETIGLSRFELMQQDNPHLVKPYNETYIKVNRLFKNEIKDFADKIIETINRESKEKLIDENGEYTEYGEYIIDSVAPTITKYAMLKSLAASKLGARILPNGDITYDYKAIKEVTDLESLGINASNPSEEALMLEKLISKGLNKLSNEDVSFVAKSISKKIDGTSLTSFRLAEAIVDKAGLGLAIRLDAAKDVMDMDAVRNGDMSFDDAWDQVIDFWSKVVEAVKKVNPNIYIVAEITDVDFLIKDVLGEDVNAYNPNNPELGFKYKNVQAALQAFYNKTGITSEAGYSYTFTDMLKTFSAEFEKGEKLDESVRKSNFISRLHELMTTRGVDFVRNLFTFADNHDKPSVLHGMALDMGLFFSNYDVFDSGKLNIDKNRWPRMEAMRILTNSNSYEEMPLEAQLNIDNIDYFRTVSSRAVAMSKLFRDIINEDLKGIATEEEIALLNQAVQDLTNGNYLGSAKNIDMQTINIPELKTLESALKSILEKANINLSTNEFEAIINTAKDKERLLRYTVYGDFNWDGNGQVAGKLNQDRAHIFVPTEHDLMGYSTYTVAVAALLNEAFGIVKGFNNELHNRFIDGGRSFIKEFDRETVEANRSRLPFVEDSAISMKKNGYAARDFETVVRMIIEQANYIAQNSSDKQELKNTEEILIKLFRSSTEPAVQKAVMYSAYLSAFPGIPTVYFRNILCALGFDEKSKNVYLQNRNVVPWSQLESGPLKEYRTQVMDMFLEAINIRSREGVIALNNGTPYRTHSYVDNGNKCVDNEVPSYLMQDAKGNMTLSIFNPVGINPHNRVRYDKGLYSQEGNYPETINSENPYVPVQSKYDLDFIALGAGLALPVGLEFMNSDIRDKAIYVVRKIGEKLAIVNKNGGKISLNGITAKNGVAVLKHVAKVSFRGNQYNFATNPYKKIEKPIEGEKLSIIAG